MSNLQFRKKLSAELIGNYSSRKVKGSPSLCKKGKKVGGRTGINVEIQNVGDHLPVPTSSRCATCSTTAALCVHVR